MPVRVARFWLKVAFAAGLALLAEGLLFDRRPGVNLGLVSLGLLVAIGTTNAGVWRSRLSVVALSAALGLALLQIERATLLGWGLFAVAVGVAVLAPRAAAEEDAFRWALRLLAGALKAIPGPVFDLRALLAAQARARKLKLAALAIAALLPVTGGAIFLWLFAQANPLIEAGLSRLRLPALDVARLVFCALVAFAAWTALRPRGFRWKARERTPRNLGLPAITGGSVMASLVVFNLVFALQNGLDVAFLWSGAPLPEGMSLADYAHRGAYPLIVTALLAGLFVLVFLRPGTPTAASRPIRMLVMAWVAQNVFLVASTVLRTLTYIEAYSLTRMRIAALLWMGLVALGLVLIAWRLIKGKSGGWLINANALAAGVVLAACSIVDLGAVAAAWNVRHAREVGGRGVELDLCYFDELGGAALVSLAELEQRPLPPELLDRVRWKRQTLRAKIVEQQADWRAWRWRDARRLARDAQLPAAQPLPTYQGRACDGAIARPVRAAPAALTPPPKP